eukprot:5397402-Pleurochrysis_carterae.AAC.1
MRGARTKEEVDSDLPKHTRLRVFLRGILALLLRNEYVQTALCSTLINNKAYTLVPNTTVHTVPLLHEGKSVAPSRDKTSG